MLKQLKNQLIHDGTYFYGAESVMTKLIDKDPDGLDEALDDNGVIDKETLVEWLKSRIKDNLDQGYYDYVPTEVKELDEVTKSSDQYWILNAYQRVQHLNNAVVLAVIDEMEDK